MSFVPPGYISTHDALALVAEAFFPEEVAALEEKTKIAHLEKRRYSDPVANALADQFRDRSLKEDAVRVLEVAENKLREMLYSGAVTASYHETAGPMSIPAGFWATEPASGVLMRAQYFPYGRPLLHSPYGAYVVTPVIAEGQLKTALDPEAKGIRTATPTPSVDRVAAFLKGCVDRTKSQDGWREEAEAHFGCKIPDKNIWRPAWRQVPANQKLRQGEQPETTS